MLGVGIILPFIAMAVGALFAAQIGGQSGLVWGGAIGFGIGCAIVALIWLVFAIVKKWADG
jgi:hypothetical protein